MSLITSLLSALAITIVGVAMVSTQHAAPLVQVGLIGVGGVLSLWHIVMLLRGVGRRHAQTQPKVWLGLIVVAGFGVVAGYGLFDVLTGSTDASHITLLIASVAGLIASLVTYFRDAHIADGLTDESIHYHIAPQAPESEPALARRALSSGVDLWEAPTQIVEQPKPARRALEN